MEKSSHTLEENKLTHELGALLYSLGSDILKKQIELKLDESVSNFNFSNSNELMNICTQLYEYKIDSWKIARLCNNLYNLLSDKEYLVFANNK